MAEPNVEPKIAASPRRAATVRKPKKNQIPFGFLTVAFVIIVAVILNTQSAAISFYWLTGCGFGFVLQKGRFCFTASMRDPYLTGSTSVTRSVIIAMAITTVGFTAIKYGYSSAGLPVPGMSYVVPISFATIFGAFIFGIGMVIAGGCASGTLMRVGEGFYMNLLALVFFVIGSLWGAHDFGFWSELFISKGTAVFLPDIFGWLGAVLLQLGVLLALYIFAEQYEKKRSASH
ncbi:MAG TPA: YeeE/YedE thiosulfate transporter family protein [Clostridiaceae bacterium]|nr:YeeE/YedE thiosulfate transporter family protein [Clostridiaceae bacterium]